MVEFVYIIQKINSKYRIRFDCDKVDFSEKILRKADYSMIKIQLFKSLNLTDKVSKVP